MSYKRKLKTEIGKSQLYKFYKYNHSKPLGQSDFRKVVSLFNAKLADRIARGLVVNMPYGLGCLGVVKHPVKIKEVTLKDGRKRLTAPINWQETNKLWKEYPELRREKWVYHENDVYYRSKWGRKECTVPNIVYYQFKRSEQLSRKICKAIKSGELTECYDF